MSETKSREWLLYNAVLAWIHNYATMDGTLAEQYVSLRKELEFEYEGFDEQPENTETRKRGRPAKRQRASKASSNPSSTEKNKTTNQEA